MNQNRQETIIIENTKTELFFNMFFFFKYESKQTGNHNYLKD